MEMPYAQCFIPTLAKLGRGEQGCESTAPRAGIVLQHCTWKYPGTIAPKYQNILCKKKLLVYLQSWVLLDGGWRFWGLVLGFDPYT